MSGPFDGDTPYAYNMFTLLRRAEREAPSRERIGSAVRRAGDVATLSQDPYLEFPASNVTGVGLDDKGRLDLAVRFLGLLGPQGALPLHMTEDSRRWLMDEDPAFARFLDIFNNRFIQLFYRAWADSRPAAHRDRPDDDRFLGYVGALVGLADAPTEPDSGVSTLAKAAYAGLLAPRVKSASRLRSFLAGLFDVDVAVLEFVPVALPLAPEDQSALGTQNSGLGTDLVIGSSVLSFDEKVRIRVTVGSLEEYVSFLPSGPNSVRLADAIAFYLGDELDWDIELALPAKDAPPAALGESGRLGWTGWMNPQHKEQTQDFLADARFRPPPPGRATPNA